MTIRHHPQPDTLMSYASGALPGAIAGLVACHVSICPQCAGSLRRLGLVAGLLLERVAPEAYGDDYARRAVHRMHVAAAAAAMAQKKPKYQPSDRVLPIPLARYLGMSGSDIPWQSVVKGVQQYWVTLPKGAGEIRLVRAAPRIRLLAHSHRGMELTMVLRGSYRDKTGEYHPGDVSDLGEDIEHQPKVTSPEDCICIIASEKPPRYSHFLARLVQPFMGF
ncbi:MULTISPECIES: ChrR family anti-sigma-E factor [Rhodomicrobium]|uniref:ChrR family anti-sigma-E factor n=1 Tax=Rhodomicrobium TaxID=1068 RepID=UPI000B4B46EB|nr:MULTISPECIES: ChrR family anti-sigma-E factor [Rhodomicrobium]